MHELLKAIFSGVMLAAIVAPAPAQSAAATAPVPRGPAMFQDDLDFLQKHVKTLVLADSTGRARIAVVGDWQARVMTSTPGGEKPASMGWINRPLIAAGGGLPQPHITPYGGEDRFWLGPEGGQFSLFFKPGEPYDLEHWQTPSAIDSEPFQLVSFDESRAHFRRDAILSNRSGTQIRIGIDRTIRVLEKGTAAEALGVNIPDAVDAVAFETFNVVANAGEERWTRDGGLISIWILGMFPPSQRATIVAPFVPGADASLGPVVNDAYFGKIPAARLVIGDGVLFFRADGRERGKIGLSPGRAKNAIGAYDPERHTLTIVQFSRPEGMTDYVNSMWEDQKAPLAGDVANAYNDGPPAPGAAQLGPFYELESSSPALALKPGQSFSHTQRTIHLQGSDADLDPIAKAVLGAGIAEIESKFGE